MYCYCTFSSRGELQADDDLSHTFEANEMGYSGKPYTLAGEYTNCKICLMNDTFTFFADRGMFVTKTS